MSFLAPFFLLGTLAVALPLVFHLIRRTSKERVPFSSLIFLQPSPPRMTKRSRLEHILLLLLRCLVICLLALGFARPFLQTTGSAPQAQENGQKYVILLDTSASMRREGLWASAVGKAQSALNKTTAADQVAIFTFDAQPHAFISFDQWGAMNAADRIPVTIKRLGDLQPGWLSTHLGHALTRAAEAFSDADKKRPGIGARHIILISDLQEGARLDGLQGYDWPKGVDVQLQTVSAKKPSNLGIQWLVDAGDSVATESEIPLRLRVSNSANSQKEGFQLHWENVNGVKPLDLYVPPGQSRVVSAPKLPPNASGEKLVVSGDDDEFDNSVYVVQPKAEQIKVHYLGEEPEQDSSQPLYYLKRAFQQTRKRNVAILNHSSKSPLAAVELSGSRVAILGGALSEANSTLIQSFVNEGGTALVLVRNAAAAGSLASLAGTGALTINDVTAPNYAMLGQIAFDHPLFAPFADPRFNDFTKIHFWKYRKVDPAAFTGAKSLARFDNGDPALLEIPKGKGRLLILTSGWQPEDSQLALSSKFVPLLYAILELAGGVKGQITQVNVGDPVDVSIAAVNAGSAGLTIRKPDGTSVQLASGETHFNQTDQPGSYLVTSVEPPLRFAVNLDSAESRTAPLPVDELERLGVPMKLQEIEPAAQVEQKRRLHDAELEGQQKLWRWLTLAALMLLLLETWVAGRLSRRTVIATEGTV